VTRGEAQKFSPYQVKTGSEKNCFIMDSSGHLQNYVKHNGKTFIYQQKYSKTTKSTTPNQQRSLLSTLSHSQKTPEKSTGKEPFLCSPKIYYVELFYVVGVIFHSNQNFTCL
jgi:hypothetical protein